MARKLTLLPLALALTLLGTNSVAAEFKFRIPIKGTAGAAGPTGPTFSYRGDGGVTVTSVSFPNISVGGASTTQTVSLMNSGTAAVTFTTPAQAVAPFHVVGSSCSGSLPAGQTCTIDVQFRPTTQGDFTNGYAVTIGADATIPNLPLTGTGITPQFASIMAGGDSIFGQLTDGTWRVAGNNGYGQLGTGATATLTSFTSVPSLTSATRIVATARTTFAQFPNGRWAAAGDNSMGQLGVGNTTAQHSFVWVPALDGATDVIPGVQHTIARAADGTWIGAGGYQPLGLGAGASDTANFVAISGLAGATEVRVVAWGTLGKFADGTWVGAGANASLGRGTGVNPTYTGIPELTNATQVITSYARSGVVANLSNGTWAVTGNAAWSNTTSFTSVPSLSGALSVFMSQNATFAKFAGDTWRAAGDTSLMGLGGYSGVTTSFSSLSHFNGVTSVSTGGCVTVARSSGGAYYTTGSTQCLGRSTDVTPALQLGLVQ